MSAAVAWGRHEGVETPRVLALVLPSGAWDRSNADSVQMLSYTLPPPEAAPDQFPQFAAVRGVLQRSSGADVQEVRRDPSGQEAAGGVGEDLKRIPMNLNRSVRVTAGLGRALLSPRHGRACHGHPRLSRRKQDVDGRHKAGHDGERCFNTTGARVSARAHVQD